MLAAPLSLPGCASVSTLPGPTQPHKSPRLSYSCCPQGSERRLRAPPHRATAVAAQQRWGTFITCSTEGRWRPCSGVIERAGGTESEHTSMLMAAIQQPTACQAPRVGAAVQAFAQGWAQPSWHRPHPTLRLVTLSPLLRALHPTHPTHTTSAILSVPQQPSVGKRRRLTTQICPRTSSRRSSSCCPAPCPAAGCPGSPPGASSGSTAPAQ